VDRERGSLSLELVLVTPLLVLLLLFIVWTGRLGQAAADVRQAAAEGARAASLTGRAAATAAAQAAVAANLNAAGVDCAGVQVAVDVGAFAPGGHVAVEVTCAVDLADVASLGLPGARTLTGRSVQVVDTYRGGT
jgi:Flp pilus assembly protein TadG